MSYEQIAAAKPAKKSQILSDKKLFLFLLAIVTIFPLIFIPSTSAFRAEVSSIDNVFRLLLLMSTMHVGLTAYFYLDNQYRSQVFDKWKYYIGFPVTLIVCAGLLTGFSPKWGLIYLMIFYHAWLLYHYGRQNYGILAFTAISTGTGRPMLLERIALHLAPIGGICASYKVLGQFKKSVLFPYTDLLQNIGILLTIIALICAIYSSVYQFRKHHSLQRPAMLMLLSCFYLPTFFFNNYVQAVMGYAIAHALQYFVFMSFLATGTNTKRPMHSLIVLIGGMLSTWGLILLTREKGIWGSFEPFVPGIGIGLIMWHFIMDAGFWKLSVPWQREQVISRIPFIFK